jgi:hypothetical protein
MKKTILNLIAILGFAFSGISQDGITMKVTGDNTDYSSGNGVYITTVGAAGISDFDIDVTNTTGSAKSWRLTRLNEAGTPSGWSTTICAGLACFPSSALNPYCTPAPTNQQLAVANSATGVIAFHVTSTTNGTGTYRIYIGDCTNFDDSIDIQVVNTLGIKEMKQNPTFTMYPNPSDDVVSISINNSKSGTVKIVDLVGNVVYNEEIYSPSKINVSEFKNGIYFVTIESEGIKLSSRKLVVRH